ncbi:hypothetical protein Tsubulata_028719 [Turnera subulata]|uniref:CCHC-type domain-containing protein n=1 Tax=Turnera subulata TaxID=218843 RepID=A0A9Q0FAH3_9ROSI|nr:hypothetical protein Tsubulata_028719 [Turnera subulata]
MAVETSWFFQKRVVVLKEAIRDEVLMQVELNELPIWIQLNNIPWNQRTKSNVMSIVVKAGTFLFFEEKGEQGWGRFVRGVKVEILFRYEGLPNFCYLCGKMDHLLKECDQRSEDSEEEECTLFGELLRASPRKPFKLRTEALSIPNLLLKPDTARKIIFPDDSI